MTLTADLLESLYEEAMMHDRVKKAYVRPQGSQLKVIGSVADLTHSGNTNRLDNDIKGGSVSNPGV